MPTKLLCKILETTTTTIYSPSPHKGTKQVLPASQREPKKYIVCFAIITLQLLTCCPVAALAVLHMFCTANSAKPVQITRGNVGYRSCPQHHLLHEIILEVLVWTLNLYSHFAIWCRMPWRSWRRTSQSFLVVQTRLPAHFKKRRVTKRGIQSS